MLFQVRKLEKKQTSNKDRKNKEKAHRYKQKVEKAYILHRLKNNEQKVKQNEKIQEVH
jgi:hypothetical protein